MKKTLLIAIAATAATFAGTMAFVAARNAKPAPDAGHDQQDLIARGDYIVRIGGCHDCHTPGYALNNGDVADRSLWLTGDTQGWQGAWGTTYPANLRLYINRMTEAQWLETSGTLQTRPPMPWFNLHDMSEYDRKAIYQFVRQLGPAGAMAPAYVPPGEKAGTAVVVFP